DGTRIWYECGSRRAELYKFLKWCITHNRRNIKELRRFFPMFGFRYVPYNDSRLFAQSRRENYFHNIRSDALKSSVVFLDPDNGLEVPSMNSRIAEKYVRYSELQLLFLRMDNSSILVVYQHLPRLNRKVFFGYFKSRLSKVLKTSQITCIADGNVCFAICVKGPDA